MKKYLFSALALTGMLFMNSCSDDLVPEPSTGDFVNATFTIGTTEGLGTRAVGDGSTVDKVACAVYDAAGNEIEGLYKNDVTVSQMKATYSVRLTKGQAYRVAFFAYNAEADAYDVTDLKNVTFKSNRLSNDERRDAFTGYVDVTAEESMNAIDKDVTLTRPFAQLNLGIDADEYEAAAKSDIVIAKSKITVTNVYNAFSAYDNAVANGATAGTMTFDLNGIPREKLVVDRTEYNYLALNYLLVGNTGAEKSLTDVEFVWESENRKTNNPTTHFINVPVQRNYRTNIVGRLLTNPADFNISIDQRFEGNKNVPIETIETKSVRTLDELQDAINEAVEGRTIITLEDDIDGGVLNVSQKEGVEIYIDGNGKNMPAVKVSGASEWDGTEGLTIDNAKFKDGATDVIVLGEDNNSRYVHNVTISNCEFNATSVNAENYTIVRGYQANDITIINCETTGANQFHSFAQFTGGANIKIEQVESTALRGLSLGTAENCVISKCTFVATGDKRYGVRHDAGCNDGSNNLKIISSTINAYFPVVVRNQNGNYVSEYTLAFEGNNTLTKGDACEYHVAIAQEEYDQVGKTLNRLPSVNLTGADSSWIIFK